MMQSIDLHQTDCTYYALYIIKWMLKKMDGDLIICINNTIICGGKNLVAIAEKRNIL
jgi:hypothetical protein